MPRNMQFGERKDYASIEKGMEFAPKFDKDGLIPAMAVDWKSKKPLMLAYMNEVSLKMTLEKGEAVYWSRSRQEIWHKGATSGHVQIVKEILVDCDQDALIVYVEQIGAGACHTGHESCFYRSVKLDQAEGIIGLEAADDGETFDPAKVYKH